jgi:hypothetical protein
MRTSLAALIFSLGLFATPVYSQEKGGDDETGTYDVIADWPEPFDRPGFVKRVPSSLVPRSSLGGERLRDFR